MAAYSRSAAPHRRLHKGMRGADVKRLQVAINLRLKRKGARTRIAQDGELGPNTIVAYRRAATLIGLPHNYMTVRCQGHMRWPWTRTPAMVARGARNVGAWKARTSQSPGAAAAEWLERRAGWTEKPAGSNDSPFLGHWRKALNMGWMRGQPWCGFACQAAYHYATKINLPNDTVSTIAIANRARNGSHFTAVPASRVRRGDLVVFHFGSGGPKHVGLARGPMRNGQVPCIEGNTSPSNAGSQANGGGVFKRSRPAGFIHTVARPK